MKRCRKNATFRIRAISSMEAATAEGAAKYQRARHLPGLIPVDPNEITGSDPTLAPRLIARIERALRMERARARAGHWSYDLNKHMGLLQALRAERAALLGQETPSAPKTKIPQRKKRCPGPRDNVFKNFNGQKVLGS